MQDRIDAGQEVCITGHEECRTGGMQDRRYAGQEACRTGSMKDRRDPGHK